MALVVHARARVCYNNLLFFKTFFICKYVKLIVEFCSDAVLNLECNIWEL